ncbi:MAG: zinc ribbon domain-containing protein [Acidobacteria bacterium]|nr:zinc ribbon domain-containing protein [Acidobacteriota bacterium]
MPLYEYECFVCSIRFERIQKTTAERTKICPECGGAVRRLLGVPALQFKGSGWYVTDYGKGTGGTAGRMKSEHSESKTPSASDSASSSSTKSSSADSSSKTSKAS